MSALLLLLPRPLYLPTTDHCRQNTTFVVPKGEAMLLRCFTYFAQKHVERLRDFLTFMPKIYSLCYKSFPKNLSLPLQSFPFFYTSKMYDYFSELDEKWAGNVFLQQSRTLPLHQVWEAHSYSAHENIFRANCCSCVVYQAKLTTNNEGSNPWHIRKVNLC